MSAQIPNLAPKPDTDDVHSTYERADNRWDLKNARRDWLIIAALIILYLVWTGTVFLLEPGIR